MPTGLVIMFWNERSGVDILAHYPDDVQIQEKILIQIYTQHEYTGEPGLVTLSAGSVNLASYFTGKDSNIYIILVLSPDEDGEQYEEGLIDASRQILNNPDKNVLKTITPSLFQRLAVYPTLNEEQRLALIVQEEPNRIILGRLHEECAVLKTELGIWMKDQYKEGFVNIDNLLLGLTKAGLIKSASVKGMSGDLVFLVEDLIMIRQPPYELLKNPVDHHLPESLVASYKTDVRHFFQHYHLDIQDCLEIIDKVMLNPQSYEVLKLLREAIVTLNDLEKLKKKGVEDIQLTLKNLWAAKMIAVYQDDKGTEYYCLVSDFYIQKIYPRYSIDTIKKLYKNKTQNFNTLAKALDLLEEEYFLINKPVSKKVSKK